MATHRERVHGEPRWPASLAVVAAILLYATLPERYTIGPAWVIPALEAAALVGLNITAPRRRPHEATILRIAATALIGLVSTTNFFALVVLIDSLIHGSKAEAPQLVFAAIQIWLTNVAAFALWFWELDRGGPGRRRDANQAPDFLF